MPNVSAAPDVKAIKAKPVHLMRYYRAKYRAKSLTSEDEADMRTLVGHMIALETFDGSIRRARVTTPVR